MSESSVAAGSKRSSLRFNFKEGLLVSYKTAHEDGEAFLVNISTGGCFVQKASVPVAVDEKVLFSIDIHSLDDPLEIQAACVRIDSEGFAAHFLGVDSRQEGRILKLLAAQARAESD